MKSDRRKFIQRIGFGITGLSLFSSKTFGSFSAPLIIKNDSKQLFFVGDNIAVTDTTYGKVIGYILRDIYHLLGIPYGAETSDENRFMLAKKPKPWTDIFPALKYGNPAPQIIENLSWYTDFMLTHTDGGERPSALSEKKAGSLVQFMKTGNPNARGLPAWPKFTTLNGETMILNDSCEVKNNPDKEARKELSST